MIVRQALFEGAIHAGSEAAFRNFVETRLVPMWRQFPGLRDLKVMFALSRDDGAPSFPLTLTMSFKDEAALAAALDAPIRLESRAVTGELMAMFDGRIHHHVFEALAER